MAIATSKERTLRRLTELAAAKAARNRRLVTRSTAKSPMAFRKPRDFADNDVKGSPAVPLRFTFDPPVPLVTKVVAGQTSRVRFDSIVQREGQPAMCGKSSFAVAELDETGSYIQVGPDGEASEPE